MTALKQLDINVESRTYTKTGNINEKSGNTNTSSIHMNNVIVSESEHHAQIMSKLKPIEQLSEIDDIETLADVATDLIINEKQELDKTLSSNEQDQALKDKSIDLIDDTIDFLNNLPNLNDREKTEHADKLKSRAKDVFDEAMNNASRNNDISVLVLSLSVAVAMMQISQTTARLLSLSSNALNESITQMGQFQQFLTKLSVVYKDALNQINKKEAEEKTTPSTQISWSVAMQYSGSTWSGQGGNLILPGSDVPDLIKKYATPLGDNNKSYSISPDDLNKVIAEVSQQLNMVLPNKSKDEYNGEFYDTYKDSCFNSITADSLIQACANKTKMLNDLISSKSNQLSINQNNAQTPATDFKQFLNIFMQTFSGLTR